MKVNTKSYPHPVLGNGDDLGGSFKVELRRELSRTEIVLNPTFVLQNASIEDLLKKGKASFVIEVECRSAFYRKSFSTRKQIERFTIPATALRERVTVGFYICADQDIKNYRPSEPHDDYEGATFDIDAGDIMALGGQYSFLAEKSFDPLRPPVSSFMSIVQGSQHEGPMEMDYENEKITIILSKADWKNYLEVRGQKLAEGILHASIVFPALIDAIHTMRRGDGEYEGMAWYGRLEAILEAKSLQDNDPFEVAQRILENPISRSFKSVEALSDDTYNDETYD